MTTTSIKTPPDEKPRRYAVDTYHIVLTVTQWDNGERSVAAPNILTSDNVHALIERLHRARRMRVQTSSAVREELEMALELVEEAKSS